MAVALLSYRSKPHCGGQGVYVRHLSRELAALGHRVTVYSGQPYPDLDPAPADGPGSIELIKVPSLDLYREPDPFRLPHPREYRDPIDVLEVATMLTGGFPEPMTFSLRVARLLRDQLAAGRRIDVVHDNQTLGRGLLEVQRVLPLVTTIHHPISQDRRTDRAAASSNSASASSSGRNPRAARAWRSSSAGMVGSVTGTRYPAGPDHWAQWYILVLDAWKVELCRVSRTRAWRPPRSNRRSCRSCPPPPSAPRSASCWIRSSPRGCGPVTPSPRSGNW
ncbi:hypothetical protein CGZ93_05915 [Enemella dayhoffiae]|uniref:Glycosyltransferase subfamily 4-like N-terminal domain-containing protein n=1 Tax=Enemella dayhoffiae TaxID=2016507 RepID=A0A255H783_9ACTN|nr:hypothetical protein CGZ93_05915 [Enemella dayhoffiae]